MFKYFGGECSPQEIEDVEHWRSGDDAADSDFKATKKLWEYAGRETGDFQPNLNAAWHRLNRKALSESQLKVYYHQKQRKNTPLWYMAAASLLLVGAFIGYMALHTWYSPKAEWQAVTTSSNQQQELVLPDGSKVWINENSRFEYPEAFVSQTREIKLQGEAFFEVKPGEKPFVIAAGNTITQVLGTSFNVSAYGDEGNVTVSVVSGKVAFSQGENSDMRLELSTGDEGTYVAQQQKLTRGRIADANFLAWQTGILKYDNQPFKDVIKDLEEHYATPIRVEGNFNKCFITTTFDNLSIEEVLEVLSMIIKNGQYSSANNGFLIKGKGC